MHKITLEIRFDNVRGVRKSQYKPVDDRLSHVDFEALELVYIIYTGILHVKTVTDKLYAVLPQTDSTSGRATAPQEQSNDQIRPAPANVRNPPIMPQPAAPGPTDVAPDSPNNEIFNMETVATLPTRAPGSPRSGPHSPQRRNHRANRANNKKGKDVWEFFENFPAEKPKRRQCKLCQHLNKTDPSYMVAEYSVTTGTDPLRTHLLSEHLELWVDGCDRLNIEITAKKAQTAVEQYRQKKGQDSVNMQRSGLESERPEEKTPFSREAFVEALTEFVIADDQALSVVESKELRDVFFLLRKELTEADMPSRHIVRRKIDEFLEKHLQRLERDMKYSLAHWIEATTVTTPNGPRTTLSLRSDLIGFQRVPGHHTGEHLARAFMYVLERLVIEDKVGWVTVDNGSNNITMLDALERELNRKGIAFSRTDRHIRCFPHIVNLAVKAILSEITQLKYASMDAEEFIPITQPSRTFAAAIDRDPIAIVRSLIRTIRASSLRRQYFETIQRRLNPDSPPRQLLRDVDTRWSSTFYMIDRALDLREAILVFCAEDREVRKYELSNIEWKALETFRGILQQLLSYQKTPTLSDTIPAFEALKRSWIVHMEQHRETAPIVQAGLDKLESYRDRIDTVLVYLHAMFVDPNWKLRWFEDNAPERTQWAKVSCVRELSKYRDETGSSSSNGNVHDQTQPRRPVEQTEAEKRRLVAMDVLGIRNTQPRDASTSGARSIEQEVDAFLSDNQSNIIDPLVFWQVREIFSFIKQKADV
ncbi:hypothetical protein EUX98_g8810 [Antrodiella citrinella]|uniref:BED-type domain-containing protein n=1 Tax=Antrodiella citrinella TaxID=2447956 RepID=A0A4S4M2Y8_9APHY|nr:hypothetical protein EUX98_g8810 [Antrodiella citrinella]